jgi:GAF domain-containing protein
MDNAIADIERQAREADWTSVLATIVSTFSADSGTLHLMGDDDQLHLAAATPGIPSVVIDAVRIVPVGRGMAGLAVERKRPVDACNIQTDVTGDVRPGALATGLRGSIVVPLMHGDAARGALGIANRGERTFSDAEQERLLAIGRLIAAAFDRRSQTA